MVSGTGFRRGHKMLNKAALKNKNRSSHSKAKMGGLEFRHSRIAICRVKHVQMCVSLFQYTKLKKSIEKAILFQISELF
jgi:hypothetical protein